MFTNDHILVYYTNILVHHEAVSCEQSLDSAITKNYLHIWLQHGMNSACFAVGCNFLVCNSPSAGSEILMHEGDASFSQWNRHILTF